MAKVTTQLFGDLGIIPLQAEAPAREVLEWKTDLMTSFNGKEKVQRLRKYPRHSVTYTIPEPIGATRSQFLAQYNGLRGRWCVPMWMETQQVGHVVQGQVELLLDTSLADYRDNSLAFLYQPGAGWQVLEIAQVQPDRLILIGETQAFDFAWIAPARVAHVVNFFERTSKGHSAVTDITFEIEDLGNLDELVPAQYKGFDLYTVPTLFEDDSIRSQLRTRVDRVDFELGVVARRTPWLYNRILRPRHILCEGPLEVREFRGWLMRRCGRFRKYWEPTFENDLLNRSSGNLSTLLIVESDRQMQWPSRPHIAIELLNGTWLVREVLDRLQVSADRVQLTLSSTLAINASTIKRISFLGLKRLDTDRIELTWIGNSVARAAINTVEVSP